MRYVICIMFCFTPLFGFAQDWEDRQVFGDPFARQVLRVLSSTDTSFFVPIIDSFLAEYSDTTIEYLVTGTADIDTIFRQSPDQFDVVISSAMDLQFKLANDGYALKVEGVVHPDWAQWRHSLFAFTSEPAAIVVNRDAFDGYPIPQTRQELIKALRDRPDTFRGKLATYDVRQSGLGYLFATQDARASETYWRLMEVMGSLDTRLYCCSVEMIDDLADGTLAVAYNVLGSYALARRDTADKLEVVLPADFPTSMMRTGFVSKEAPNPDIAIAFIRHLIERQSGPAYDKTFLLPPLNKVEDNVGQSNIALGPALMTYLDELKRQRFINEWVNAIVQN